MSETLERLANPLSGPRSEASEVFREAVDSVFGRSFTLVLDNVFMGRLGARLFESARDRPGEAYALLRELFKGDRPVGIILSSILEAVDDSDASPAGRETLSVVFALIQKAAGLS